MQQITRRQFKSRLLTAHNTSLYVLWGGGGLQPTFKKCSFPGRWAGSFPECLAAWLYKQVQASSSCFWPQTNRLITSKWLCMMSTPPPLAWGWELLEVGWRNPLGMTTFWSLLKTPPPPSPYEQQEGQARWKHYLRIIHRMCAVICSVLLQFRSVWNCLSP